MASLRKRIKKYIKKIYQNYNPLFYKLLHPSPGNRSPHSVAKHGEVDQYAVINAAFDRTYYLRRYVDIAIAKIDPVKHYIEFGAREGRDPSPDFVTSYYLKRYPDVKKSGLNPFYHYLRFGQFEERGTNFFSPGEPEFDLMCEISDLSPIQVSTEISKRRQNLRERLNNGILGEMVSKAGQLEPLILHSWLSAYTAQVPPFHSEWAVNQITAMYRLHQAAKYRRAKAVIVMRSCGIGGVSRIAAHLANALVDIYGEDEVVVLYTDSSDKKALEWFPASCRLIDVAIVTQKLGKAEREKLIVEFIRCLQPTTVFNMNSPLLWSAMGAYGKALAHSCNLYAYLFCNDVNIFGNVEGYPAKQFYRYFDVYKAVITDSEFLKDELSEKFLVPLTQMHRLVAIATPISNHMPNIASANRQSGQRPKVFWAGRFDRQKRIDIVINIATRLPNIDFHIWGESVLDNAFKKMKLPKNIFNEGLYTDFSSLPLQNCDLWLYTSQWDGVPNVLFEVASAGVPLVGSIAGGCGEVLIEGLCERIDNIEDVEAFELAIRRVIAQPQEARVRANLLRDRILQARTPQKYRTAIESLITHSEIL
ncbi:MAG: hypothetical protein CTY31_06290 [Hyphomicrobium sp.]|nr:MAG: hypothetical protein CTY31_06290 [Hyphomicrobium sp.]